MQLGKFLFGNPIPKTASEDQSLSKIKALPIFSSDALSSVAYATEEILTVLVVAGAAGLLFSIHIAIFICILIAVVGISYKQAIQAYPEGGGAYVVARENFGPLVALIAAVALMIDYILTVAVSVSAGIQAITSAFPELLPYAIVLAVIAVIFIMWINLRGIRESASAFMLPTYAFISVIIILIAIGLYKYFTVGLPQIDYKNTIDLIEPTTKLLTITIILRAFSSGCSAMTGIEAISNGVSAFTRPKARNASRTLTILIVLLISMFMGISFLAYIMHMRPETSQSILSQIGHQIFGYGLWYYILQLVTCLVLLLAANTSFAGFPLLASIISNDGYLPRQLRNIGDRLSFNNGIIILAIFACLLIILFEANTNALVPLYSIGVFIAFTLCQAGLVKVWYTRRHKTRSWLIKALINSFGCISTFVATLVVVESKFTEGAWIVIIALPILFYLCYKVHAHYIASDKELSFSTDEGLLESSLKTHKMPKVIVPISKLHKGTIAALEFARSLSDDVTPVVININSEKTEKLKLMWKQLNFPEKLIIMDTIYQSTLKPLIKIIRKNDLRDPDRGLSVIILPKAQTAKWWHFILHNQKTYLLRMALNTLSKMENKGETRIIVEVPYQLHF